ncbi:hypothetical protein BJ912DRAFT_975646 [Pholiota molesta]|nr:hypothetical protein BJ912DRAFT_975646 [Pholiota molesta]
MSMKASYLLDFATRINCLRLDRFSLYFDFPYGMDRNEMLGSGSIQLSSRWSDGTISRPNITFIATFDVLYILGPVSLLAILLTAWCSPNVRRPSTWFMAVGSWVVISVANILLLGHQMGPMPPHSLCLAQATLIYASPVFCAFSAAAFLLETYFAAIHFKLPYLCGIRTHIMLFYLIPCMGSLFIIIEALTLGVLNTSMVERDASGLYCNLSSTIPRKVTGGSIMCGLLIVLIVEVLIVLAYRRTSRESTQWLDPGYIKSRPNISGDHIARILAFTTCALVAFSASLLQYLPRAVPIDNGKISLVQAALPCCASLIFGTQRDILCVWIPARYRKSNPDDIPNFFPGS